MTSTRHGGLFTGCGLAILSWVLGATAAQAQSAPAAGEQLAGLDEIIVTAQKRETNLQATPIAISVLGGADLEDRSVNSLEDLMTSGVPSLRVAPFFSRSSALTIGIRGIVPFDANQPSRDAGVGVYIDGVYLGRSQGLAAALYDIERIEVLKGPQGTLFGRNSTGGALSIVSRKPTGELGLRLTGGIGNYNAQKLEVHLDLPRVADIAFKIDGVMDRRDGTVDNPMSGEEDFNKFDKRGLRAAAQWQPGESFTADYAFDISRDATTPYYVQLLEKNPAVTLSPLILEQSDRADTADIGVPLQDSIGKVNGHMLNLSWTPSSALTLRSISSYREVDQTQYDNGGAHYTRYTPGGQFARYSLASLRQNQYSQEVQLLGSLPRLDYVAGLYYYHEKGDDDAWTPNTMQWNSTGTAATRIDPLRAGARWDFPDRASTAEADSYAAFGQATWTPPLLGDMVKLTAGARFTHDKKSGVLSKVNGANTNFEFQGSWDRLDPAVTLAVDPSENIHLYGKWGTAYRAGGANSRSVSYRAYDPEKVSTFEVGLKSDWLDNRARVNLAAYTTRYTDIQIDFSATNLNNSNRGTIETVNADGVGHIRGIEADLSFMPLPGLTLSASYAYTDWELPVAPNPFNNNAPTTVYIVYTPDHAGSGSLDYELPLDWATLRMHLDANIANGYHSSSSEATLTDKSFVVNGRLALGDIDISRGGMLQLALWARNLFNEQHTFYKSVGAYSVTGTYGMYNEPRTFGFDATVRF